MSATMMMTTTLAAVYGAALGWVLMPYTAWIVTLRSGNALSCRRAAPEALLSWAPLANGLGWALAWMLLPNPLEALEISVLLTATLALTAIDVRIRVIPNELVVALLSLSAAFTLLESGIEALPLRLLGMVVALVLFLGVALAGLGKIGGGDIKLSMAIGFAAGFPGILVAVIIMGAAALASRIWDSQPWSYRLKTELPFAGFMMIGLLCAMVLVKTHALAALGL